MRRSAAAQRGAAVLAAAGLLVLSACGGGEGRGQSAGATTELRLAIGGESEDGYDPTLGWGRYGSPLFQSTLLKRDADLNLDTDLATDYSVSDDGLVWTVRIRDDAVFTDGEPVTADDVAYTFTTASESGGLTDVTVLDRAVVVDRHTVELHLTEPQSTFVNRLVTLGIVPEHAHGPGYAQHPVGSGPFEFVQWDRGQQLIVERNDDYYGPRPVFERLVFVFTDEDATLSMAQAGEVDVATVPPSLATGQVPGMRLVEVTSVDNRGLMFPYVPEEGKTTESGAPIGNDVTSDRAIRQAINYALDRDALVEGVLEGFGSPATGPVDGTPWYEPASAIEDDDPDRAARLLTEAGWVDSDGDGVREKDGRRAEFTLIYPAGDSLRQGLALSVADMVEPIGISIDATGKGWDVIEQRMHADAVLFGWGSHDATEMYNLYSQTRAGVELFNPGFYFDAAVQRHLDAAMAATDPDTANRHWRAAQLDDQGNGFSASADAAYAWLVNLEHLYYVDECLDTGANQIEPHGHGWPFSSDIAEWRWTC